MNTEVNVSIHNRFDIEVKDAITGEITKTAVAYNNVMNTMWTRLCGGSTFFSHIQFGTGTGTLLATRTALFTFLGGKAATTVTTICSSTVSSWKRSIMLDSAEFVGNTLTEVAVAYQATTGGIVTHALIKDINGTPTSITKSSTDIITIYATIFATFSLPSGIILTNMPNGNEWVNYLVAGGVSPIGTFVLGSNDGDGDINMTSVGSTSLGATVAATWTADAANKRRYTAPMRFGATIGNGHVTEFAFGKVFRAKLPLAGVFTGQSYTEVPVGIGDGVIYKFILASKNILQSSVVIKLDGIETLAYTKAVINNNEINFAYSNPASLPGITGNCVSLSSNGLIMAVGSDGSPFITTYDLSGGAWVKRTDPAILPVSNGRGVSLSSNGLIMAVAQWNSPYVITYDWIGSAWVKRTDPAILPTGNGYGVSLSSDGLIMAISHDTLPYITTYDWSGGVWVKRPNPAILPTGYGVGVSLSSNGLIMAVAHNTSPYITTYDWSVSAWIKRTNPVILPIGTGSGVSLSSDSLIMAVAHNSSPYITTYDWSGGAWVKRPNPAILPTSYGSGVSLSSDGLIMALAHYNSPYITTYDWSGSAWIKRTNPVILPTSDGKDVSLSSDGLIMAVANDISPYVTTYDVSHRQTEITFDAPPAVGGVITSNYTVNGVHKTDQYVIDASFTIQYGEPI